MPKLTRSLLNKLTRLYQKILRAAVSTDQFTIIANNCWAGRIYEDLKLPYQSPTIGLFFYAPCFAKFASEFNRYINIELKFATESKYEIANSKRKYNAPGYPIGLIEDIEIHFLHYKTENEAKEKWQRRIERINLKNIMFKFCDRDLCTELEMKMFDSIPYKKVLFSAKKISGIRSLLVLKAFKNNPMVGDLYSNPWSYRTQFDVAEYISGSKKYKYTLRLIGLLGFLLNRHLTK